MKIKNYLIELLQFKVYFLIKLLILTHHEQVLKLINTARENIKQIILITLFWLNLESKILLITPIKLSNSQSRIFR